MEHHDKTFTLTKKEARALAAYASRDLARPNIAGIAVDTAAGSLAATDGHRAIIATVPGGDPWKIKRAPMVPAASWGAVVKAARARDRIAVQIVPDDGARLGVTARLAVVPGHATPADLDGRDPREIGATMVAAARVDTLSPPFSQVLPRYESDGDATAAPVIGFSPVYLAALADLARVTTGETALVWRHRGEHDAGLGRLQADDGTIWRVVIMPMRLSSESKGTAAA